MKKPGRLLFLMILTMLAIAGFQAFWLYQNFQREKAALKMKTSMLFREAVLAMQESKFTIDGQFRADSVIQEISIRPTFETSAGPRKQVVNMMNMVGRKTRDSAAQRQVFITVDRNSMAMRGDTAVHDHLKLTGTRNGMVRFLYSIDSLQDSIKVREVDSSYRKILAANNTLVPFQIERRVLRHVEEPDFKDEEIVVGLREPIGYKVILGNSFPFLLKRMSSPILFSIFLVGFTILSFMLLYRNLRREQRLTAVKNNFISNISHELKTPIATVSVAIEALKNFNALNDTRRTSEYLDISQNELQRLSLLVDKVLKLSMFEQKAIRLNKEWFDVCKVINEVIESMRLQLEKADAMVRFIHAEEEYRINADKLHITSVVYNLLDNALKYSPVNPEILIELKKFEEYIEIIFRDNGLGIPAEFKRKIFEKFFRVPDLDKHNIKGYGLGLSYVSHIAQMHQGFIEVDSVPGKGSSFSVKIPIQELPVIHFDHNRKITRKVFKINGNES